MAELPEDMQSIRMTEAYHTHVLERVLGMLSAGLVLYTRIVEALCDGTPVQPCYECGDQVTVVDATMLLLCGGTYLSHHPALMLGSGVVYSLCGNQRCLKDHSENNSFNQGLERLDKLYTRFSYEYWGQSCDYCGGFNQELKGYRCAGCKTKVYCAQECHVKDKVHLKLCGSAKGEERERKKKRGKVRRMEKDRDMFEKKFGELVNLVDRQKAFEEVEEVFPEILAWVMTCYKSKAVLNFGNTVIESEAGFHQGDPLASLLFSLTLHPIVKMIAQRLPNLPIQGWYLDDGDVVGNREELREVVDILLEHGPARGLHLSTTKSTVWCPIAARANNLGLDPLGRGIPLVEEEGITLLGSPVGSLDFERRVIGERMEKVREISHRLPLIQDPQTEFALLRSCLSLPKLMFTLRTTKPTHHLDMWQEYDSITRDSLSRILGSSIPNYQWEQATLPVSAGGLGLRLAEDHCHAAYISSLLGSQDLKLQILRRNSEECPPTSHGRHVTEAGRQDR